MNSREEELAGSKSMHGQPSVHATKPKRAARHRVFVTLPPTRDRKLNRFAVLHRRDKSSFVADAVECVYGRGERHVQLRSSMLGLGRVMMLLTLLDNRLASLAAEISQARSEEWADLVVQATALARLEIMHHDLGRLMRVVASWRKHDAEELTFARTRSRGDVSSSGKGGGQ